MTYTLPLDVDADTQESKKGELSYLLGRAYKIQFVIFLRIGRG